MGIFHDKPLNPRLLTDGSQIVIRVLAARKPSKCFKRHVDGATAAALAGSLVVTIRQQL
jgi:hypothetical protein